MMRRDGGRLFQTSGPQTVNASGPSSVRVRRVTDGCTSGRREQRSSLWVGRAEGNEVGNVRRIPFSYDLVHEDCEFELDAVLHRHPVKLRESFSLRTHYYRHVSKGSTR